MQKKARPMTEGQRIKALLKRQKPDRVPNWPFFDMTGFAAVYHDRPISDAYKDPKVSLEMQRKVCQDFGWICSPFFPAFDVEEYGGKVKLPDSEFAQAPFTTRFPIESEDDVGKLKIPDFSQSVGISREREFHRLVMAESYDSEPFRTFLLLMANPFDTAGSLCGPERLSRWLIKKPELVHRLLRLASDILKQKARYWHACLGTKDILLFSGGVICSNQIISPKHFEQFVLPYLKDGHQKVLDMGYRHFYCHICGEHNLNLPLWAQVPMGDPGIVSIGHEVDLEKAAQYFPKDIILGNLEPVIMQTGTPDDVYEATKKVIIKGKRLSGRFIFSMGCQFPPRTSLENAKAMNAAVDDFGWYA
jgi:uroporphyrinogen decarboxylase